MGVNSLEISTTISKRGTFQHILNIVMFFRTVRYPENSGMSTLVCFVNCEIQC